MIVADDAALLGAVRRMFDPLAGEWEASTARDAADALARLADAPVDTLVADARVAGMGCDELLQEVRRHHPQTVRIALAGPADQAQLIRLVAVANRVIGKPCGPDELPAAVRRAHSLRELLGSPALAAVVGRMGSVPTLSALYTKIADELALPDFSLARVGDLVGQDAGITAKLLQVANSALLGLRRPAASPGQAVRVLGADLTRTLVLAADLFSRYNPAALRPFSIDALWDHSRRVAETAGRVAAGERAPDRVVRDATLAGLFHDIGRLTIASQLPGLYREVLGLIRAEGLPVAAAERRVIGASHAEVGGYLLGIWGLPDPLIEAVAWHHAPAGCPGAAFTALTAVHVAEVLAAGDEEAELDFGYLDRLGLAEKAAGWVAPAGAAVG
jgi:HD-like signal output (HDOD) protein